MDLRHFGLVPSELPLSTHLPTSKGWTAELAVGLWLVVPTTEFEPTWVDLTRFDSLRLYHSAVPLFIVFKAQTLSQRNTGIYLSFKLFSFYALTEMSK